MTLVASGASPCDFVLRGAGELVTMAPGSVKSLARVTG